LEDGTEPNVLKDNNVVIPTVLLNALDRRDIKELEIIQPERV
jgi:hypothetical protein